MISKTAMKMLYAAFIFDRHTLKLKQHTFMDNETKT